MTIFEKLQKHLLHGLTWNFRTGHEQEVALVCNQCQKTLFAITEDMQLSIIPEKAWMHEDKAQQQKINELKPKAIECDNSPEIVEAELVEEIKKCSCTDIFGCSEQGGEPQDPTRDGIDLDERWMPTKEGYVYDATEKLPNIWVLTLVEKGTTKKTLHYSKNDALDYLLGYVLNKWTTRFDKMQLPAESHRAIMYYYGDNDNETYTLHEEKIHQSRASNQLL